MLSFLFLLVLLPVVSSDFSDPDLRLLEDFILLIMREHNIPGVSLSLVKNGESVSRGYGFADLDKNIRATETTPFAIGSLTKGFTVALLGLLLEQTDGITWDTPIRDILGDEFVMPDDFRTSQTSLKDILSHRTGFPTYFLPMLVVGFPETVTRAEIVRRLRYFEAESAFRTKFTYNNYMYALAGYIAEQLSAGTKWEELVRKRIFKPLGMTNALFADVDPLPSNMALPHLTINKKIRRISEISLKVASPLGPAGSIAASAVDMAKWMKMNLNSGRDSQNRSLLSPALLDDIFDGQILFRHRNKYLPKYPIEDVSISYNLGWMTSVYRGYKKVWHSGGISSYTSYLWLFTDMNVGIYACVNGPSSTHSDPIMAIMYYAADLMLGIKPWLSNSSDTLATLNGADGISEVPSAKPQPPSWNITKPDMYVGVYGNLAFGNVTIHKNGSTLYLKMGRYGLARLSPSGGENEFALVWLEDLEYLSSADDSSINVQVKFTFREKSVDSLTINSSLKFIRDLQLTDAPSRVNVACYSTSSGVRQILNTSLSIVYFAYVVHILYVF